MQWVRCTTSTDLLGEREGHCAATLALTHPDADTDVRYVLVFGGYCAGELTGVPILSPVAALPALSWTALAYQAPLECDGASLTCTTAHEALLFGGLDADLNRCAALYCLRLVAACRDEAAAPVLSVTAVPTTGDVPAPRSRHGAGFSAGRLFIFAGETETCEQTNDLYELSTATGVWRRIACGGPDAPAPRLLSLSLVFVTTNTMVVYGGCRYVQGEVQSLDDVWAFTREGERWTELRPAPVAWPRCNGHRGCRVSAAAAVFLGGKDRSTGDDRVRVVRLLPPGEATFAFELVEPAPCAGAAPPATPSAEAGTGDEEEEEVNSRMPHPHWRYTSAVVEVPGGLLVLGGQCRHPQRPSAYLLAL